MMMEETKNTQRLVIPYCQQLDELMLEDASAVLEQEIEKYSVGCRNWAEEYPYHPVTVFTVAYSDKYIYVDFFVHGNYLRAVNYKNNTPVSEDSCVGLLFKHPGKDRYWNFEFNCIGTTRAYSCEVGQTHEFLTDEQISQVKRYASCGTKPFEEMEGLFGWEVVVAIPLSLIEIDINDMPKKITGNFYKCGSKTDLPHNLSWSPIATPTPDFCRTEYFGDLFFAEK